MSASLRPRLAAASAVGTAPSSASSLQTIVVHGLHQEQHAPIGWGGGISALAALMAAIWPSIEGSIETLIKS